MFSKGLLIFYILAVISRAEDNIEARIAALESENAKTQSLQQSLKLMIGSIQTSTNPVQNDNSLSHIEALLSIQLAHLERLTNMTEAALIQSGKIMNDFMVFASAMENFAPKVNSCKKKQEPEPPYQEQRDIDFTHYFWPKRIVESIMGSRNEGSIQSMHPYRNNENRKVTISTPCAALVWRIRRLSMEESTDCIADYLVINYGQYTSGKLCGTSADIYEEWTFHFGSSFDITFYTDCSENGYGFFIEWQCSETEPAHPIDVDDEDALSYDQVEPRNMLPDLPTGFDFNPIDLSNDTPSPGSEHVSGEVFITADDDNDENNSVSNSEASGDHDYSETSYYNSEEDSDSDSSSYD